MSDEPELLDCGHRKDLAVGLCRLGSIGKTICAPCNDRRKRDVYRPLVIRRERQPLKVGSSTMVGVMGFADPAGPCAKCGHDHVVDPNCVRYGDGVTVVCSVNNCGGEIPIKDPFPIGHGNCCSVLNMNTENVTEALERWPELAVDCEVEVVRLGKRERVRVVDKRLPDAWKQHTCSGCGVYEGDSEPMPYPNPDDAPPDMKSFTAPYVSIVRPDAMNLEVRNFGAKSRKLKSTWSLGSLTKEDLDDDSE